MIKFKIVALALAAAVVVLLASSGGSDQPAGTHGGVASGEATGLAAAVPAELWKGCSMQSPPRPAELPGVPGATGGLDESAVCHVPGQGIELTLNSFHTKESMNAAYQNQLTATDVPVDSGECSVTGFHSESLWYHGGTEGEVGGRSFCLVDGSTGSYIAWTVLPPPGSTEPRWLFAIAGSSGTDHPGLLDWWNVQHHMIGYR